MKSEFFQKTRDAKFNPAPQLKIDNDLSFFLRFDGTHKMWYTMSNPDEIPTPDIESDKFAENQVKTVETMYQGKTYVLDVPTIREIRTSVRNNLKLNECQ